MYQHIVIVGNVGRDPNFRYTPSGVAVCDFSVCVNKVIGKGENRKEKSTWFNVTCWRERAETAGHYITKGMKILVEGEMGVSAYIDKGGQAVGKLELTASEFKFLESRNHSQEPQTSAAGNNDTPPEPLPGEITDLDTPQF